MRSKINSEMWKDQQKIEEHQQVIEEHQLKIKDLLGNVEKTIIRTVTGSEQLY